MKINFQIEEGFAKFDTSGDNRFNFLDFLKVFRKLFSGLTTENSV